MAKGLSDEGRRVVEALIRASVAWQSPEELALAIGAGLEETLDLVANLDADGWLVAWEREDDLVVTLSVVAASSLGLRLVETGRDEVPRWAGRGDPEPPGRRASGVFRGQKAAGLELVVDPSATAEETIERAEEALIRFATPADPRVRVLTERLPIPTLIVGTGLTPWPGLGNGRKASCPACGSKRLSPSAYCLYCDRWGLDHLLVDRSAERTRPTIEPRDDSRRREAERLARLARRKSRRLAQTETERASKRRRRHA